VAIFPLRGHPPQSGWTARVRLPRCD